MIHKIDHFVIIAKDVPATMDFYQKLGFVSRDVGNRHELHAGDFKINIHALGRELSPHAKNVRTGSCDFCFEIMSDITDFYNALQQKGLEIELGIVERTGVKGTMRSIYLRDPDGNLVEISSYD